MKIGGVLFAEKELKNRLKSILKSRVQTPSKNQDSKQAQIKDQKENSFYFKEEEVDSQPNRSPSKKAFPRIASTTPPEP